MTGDRRAFVSLDESVHGMVKFGDGSLVSIKGHGSVVLRCNSGNQRVLTSVFFIPALRSNIVSVGQLDEAGSRITIEDGVMAI